MAEAAQPAEARIRSQLVRLPVGWEAGRPLAAGTQVHRFRAADTRVAWAAGTPAVVVAEQLVVGAAVLQSEGAAATLAVEATAEDTAVSVEPVTLDFYRKSPWFFRVVACATPL